MNPGNNIKNLIWLDNEIKTSLFYRSVRIEVGFLLAQLLNGEILTTPMSKPMASIGDCCHELRVNDLNNNKNWRLIYRIDNNAILILEVFAKTTKKTPNRFIINCQSRIDIYDRILAKGQQLEPNGWRIASVDEFLKLSPEEITIIEIRLSLSEYLDRLKQQQLAPKLPPHDSWVARMAATNASLSIELLIESLLTLGATRKDIAAAIAGD
jgi:phage-related protein